MALGMWEFLYFTHTVYTHTQPGSSGEGVIYRKPQQGDELFPGTQKQTKDKKRQNQKEKDVPPTVPVYRCQYDHSQQLTLVVISRRFAYTIYSV